MNSPQDDFAKSGVTHPNKQFVSLLFQSAPVTSTERSFAVLPGASVTSTSSNDVVTPRLKWRAGFLHSRNPIETACFEARSLRVPSDSRRQV